MYPMKFKKILKEKVWGGRGFEEVLHIMLPSDESFGESWEVSCHKNGTSIVENGPFKGKKFSELIKNYKGQLEGEEVYKKFGENFPLLIKFLDIHDKLSVQVHPSDNYALRVEGELGKSESWYVVEASPDAKVIMGIKKGISRSDFEKRIENHDFNGVFNIIPIKKGDFINVEPGLVHASIEGWAIICEIQENSDTTYRIYDFDRLVDGKLRDLHFEKAKDVINYDLEPKLTSIETRKKKRVEDAEVEELIKGEYFNIDRLSLHGRYHEEKNKNFKIFSCLNGEGIITCQKKKYFIHQGDTYFIPPMLDLEFEGEVEVLKSYL